MRLASTTGVARATLRELLRSPAAILLPAVVTVVLILVAIVATALRTSGESFAATNATLTTTSLAAAIVAGCIGIRTASPNDPIGPSVELGTTSLSALSLRTGRWAGTVAATTSLLAAGAMAATLASGVLGTEAIAWTTLGWLIAEAASTAALFAGLGMLLRSSLPDQLAYLVLAGVVVLLRVAVPSAEGLPATLSWLLPDSSRALLLVEQSAAPALTVLALVAHALQGLALAAVAPMRTQG